MPRPNIRNEILGYRIQEELGSGTFGTVYKVVKQNASGTYVRALKHITIPTSRKQYSTIYNSMGGSVEKTNDYFNKMLQDIVSEVQILNDLSEKNVPNVVRYYENDIKTTKNPLKHDIFILMEYLNPLDEYIYNNYFTVRDVAILGLDILRGLKACHDNGIIHRDVKIDNIFATDNGEFKIGDFGVSKVLTDGSRAASLKGTPDFLAPEVYLGNESYNKSIDLYSLGIVLYRLLNHNRNPFLPAYPNAYYGADEEKAFSMRMSGTIPDPPSMGGPELGRVIVKAISNKEFRYKSAEEFAIALENALNNTSPEYLQEQVTSDYVPKPKDTDVTVFIDENPDETIIDTGDDSYPGRDSYPGESYTPPGRGSGGTNPNVNPPGGVGSVPPNILTPPTLINPPFNEPHKKKGFSWAWFFAIASIIVLTLILVFLIYEIFVATEISGPVSAPTYTVASGTYDEPINVQIETFKPDFRVFYTLDGTNPTTGSLKYTSGENIYIATTTTLKSIAVDPKGNKSLVNTANYIITNEVSLEIFENNLIQI